MSDPTNQFTAPAPAAAAPKKKSRKRLWIILGSLVLLVAVVAGAIVKNKNKDKAIVVTTEKAVIKTITQTVNATGKVQPETEVKIAPEVSGEIIELRFFSKDAYMKEPTRVIGVIMVMDELKKEGYL